MRILAVNSILEKTWIRGKTFVVIDGAGNLARAISRDEYMSIPALEKIACRGGRALPYFKDKRDGI